MLALSRSGGACTRLVTQSDVCHAFYEANDAQATFFLANPAYLAYIGAVFMAIEQALLY